MTAETLLKIRDLLPTISDHTMLQFALLIEREVTRRAQLIKRNPGLNGFWELTEPKPNNHH